MGRKNGLFWGLGRGWVSPISPDLRKPTPPAPSLGIGESTRVTNVPTILGNKWIKGLEMKALELTKEDGGIIIKYNYKLNRRVTRAPLLLLRSWVALSFKICQSVSQGSVTWCWCWWLPVRGLGPSIPADDLCHRLTQSHAGLSFIGNSVEVWTH